MTDMSVRFRKVTIFVLTVSPAFPCSCVSKDANSCTVPEADVLVLAKVASIDRPYGELWANVALDVLEAFRGAPTGRLIVRTMIGSTCGYQFERGQDYLVFASKYEGSLEVSFCSSTQPATWAASRIHQLRAAQIGTPLSILFGSVLTYAPGPGNEAEKDVRPAAGLTVVARSGEKEYRAKTADDGFYEFPDIPAGEYRVRVDTPSGLVLRDGWQGSFRTYIHPQRQCPLNLTIVKQLP